MVKITHYPSL